MGITLADLELSSITSDFSGTPKLNAPKQPARHITSGFSWSTKHEVPIKIQQ